MTKYIKFLNTIDRVLSSRSKVSPAEMRMYEEDVAAHFATLKHSIPQVTQ